VRRQSWGRDPTWAQTLGGRWGPVGAEAVDRSMDGSAAQAVAAGGGGPCSVVWWVFLRMGSHWVVSWWVGSVEVAGGRGWKRPGGGPVRTGAVGGTSVGFW